MLDWLDDHKRTPRHDRIIRSAFWIAMPLWVVGVLLLALANGQVNRDFFESHDATPNHATSSNPSSSGMLEYDPDWSGK